MDKDKIEEVVGFTFLGICLLLYIIFVFYKLVYAPYHDLSDHKISEFGENILLVQGLLLTLAGNSMVKDFASNTKWYSKVLIYIIAFIIFYAISGGFMSVIDLLTGRPFVIL